MRTYPQSAKVTTPAASTPVTLAEAKAQCRVEIDDDNTKITSLIAVATEHAERLTQRALMPQTCKAKYNAWPTDGDDLWIPFPPITAVSSVKYFDINGTEQTWSSSGYQVDLSSEPARLRVKSGYSYPALEEGKMSPITVDFTAGYADAASVPASIKHAILLLISLWYDNGADATEARLSPIPMGASSLLDMHAITWGF